MSRVSPPLRFLALTVAGWACVRAALLAPPWWAETAVAEARPKPKTAALPAAAGRNPTILRSEANADRSVQRPLPSAVPSRRTRPKEATAAVPEPAPAPFGRASAPTLAPLPLAAPPGPPPLPSSPARPGPGRAAPARWTFSGWLFARRGGGTSPLAAGGMLGGSQVGGRLLYRLNGSGARPLALSGRLSTPAGSARAAEAALGLDWRPARELPVSVLAERRQALAGEGRNAFALTLYGGVSERPLGGRLRLDAYAQAGVVGLRSRDLFADGSARLSLPVGGGLKLGGGMWGAAQPGVARFDLGPQASLPLPGASGRASLALDWRFRAAGNARPGSGPSLTLSTGF
jgi:hypothetical protein